MDITTGSLHRFRNAAYSGASIREHSNSCIDAQKHFKWKVVDATVTVTWQGTVV